MGSYQIVIFAMLSRLIFICVLILAVNGQQEQTPSFGGAVRSAYRAGKQEVMNAVGLRTWAQKHATVFDELKSQIKCRGRKSAGAAAANGLGAVKALLQHNREEFCGPKGIFASHKSFKGMFGSSFDGDSNLYCRQRFREHCALEKGNPYLGGNYNDRRDLRREAQFTQTSRALRRKCGKVGAVAIFCQKGGAFSQGPLFRAFRMNGALYSDSARNWCVKRGIKMCDAMKKGRQAWLQKVAQMRQKSSLLGGLKTGGLKTDVKIQVKIAAAKCIEDKQTLRAAQQHLNRLNHNVGTVDGLWGARSKQAYRAFLKSRKLAETDCVTAEGLKLLAGSK